jgi:hypothetical protein
VARRINALAAVVRVEMNVGEMATLDFVYALSSSAPQDALLLCDWLGSVLTVESHKIEFCGDSQFNRR